MPQHNQKSNPFRDTGKFMSSVKVGPKGQVVIPKEVRDMFDFGPGDTLLLLADAKRGIALHRLDYFDKVADEIFLKAEEDETSSQERAAGMKFAKAIKTVQTSKQED